MMGYFLLMSLTRWIPGGECEKRKKKERNNKLERERKREKEREREKKRKKERKREIMYLFHR